MRWYPWRSRCHISKSDTKCLIWCSLSFMQFSWSLTYFSECSCSVVSGEVWSIHEYTCIFNNCSQGYLPVLIIGVSHSSSCTCETNCVRFGSQWDCTKDSGGWIDAWHFKHRNMHAPLWIVHSQNFVRLLSIGDIFLFCHQSGNYLLFFLPQKSS